MVPEKAHGVGDAGRILYIKYVVSCQQGADSFYRCADAADDPYAIQKNVVIFSSTCMTGVSIRTSWNTESKKKITIRRVPCFSWFEPGDCDILGHFSGH